jgi:diguanylate cyclase (GGDEF)-like protein
MSRLADRLPLVPGRRHVARALPLRDLQPRLRWYVVVVSAAAAGASAAAAAGTSWRATDAVTCGLLLGFGAVTVETIRRMGEPSGAHKDAHGVWELATAVLLGPFYALTAPAVIFALTQWRVRRTVTYRRVFSAAAIGLSYGAASLVFHAVQPGPLPATHGRMAGWVALAAACAALRYAINNILVAVAVRFEDPASGIRDVIGGMDGLYNDLAELSVGVLVAASAALTPVALIVALPCGTMLQRSASHAQLRRASRTDAKTGLLTGPAWEREAAIQIAQARRTGSPLAVALLDLDHFKQVNDTYGHLVGDAVLRNTATTITATLRAYDLAGRFGGEEFCVLLPSSTAAEALATADRLRAAIGQIAIPGGVNTDGPQRITASVGVAALDEGTTGPADLLAAADAALYQAKNSGRNTVCLASPPQH